MKFDAAKDGRINIITTPEEEAVIKDLYASAVVGLIKNRQADPLLESDAKYLIFAKLTEGFTATSWGVVKHIGSRIQQYASETEDTVVHIASHYTPPDFAYREIVKRRNLGAEAVNMVAQINEELSVVNFRSQIEALNGSAVNFTEL